VTEVLSGRVDASGLETPVNTALYKEQHGGEIKFIPDVDHPVTEVPSSWTLKKGDAEFQKYVSDFLAEQVANGFMDELKAKYLKPEFILQQ
jgi:ABC-type amino acid transport substrate-binding protein